MILYTYINYVYTIIQVYSSIYQDIHGIYDEYHGISDFQRLILVLLYMNGISPLNLQCRVMSTDVLMILNCLEAMLSIRGRYSFYARQSGF